ncbi:hypothetical protein CHITON_0924 [Thermococcus chitonophagus]|nr:hypothetical protein CHITON_0924 [Thermococcus chitonophagus]
MELEKKIRELEEENERLRRIFENMPKNREERELVELKERIDKILEKYGELKLVEFMKKVFGLPLGENLKEKTKQFVDEYFVNKGNLLISEELGLVIEKKADVGILGWTVRKL